MLPFQWKALRIGDHVVVHDDSDRQLTLHDGVVRRLAPNAGDDRQVIIKLDDEAGVVRPRRQAVHIAPVDRRFACWRCDAIADAA
ncbi:MAG TPA: hypothetical protein VNQ73_18595 [Ilumatobacter sp.]|nr:hypothetical protein [Ilumatobacter sp.]